MTFDDPTEQVRGLQAGQIIVGAATTKVPGGVLRTVAGVEDDLEGDAEAVGRWSRVRPALSLERTPEPRPAHWADWPTAVQCDASTAANLPTGSPVRYLPQRSW
ncbi:hypothetical protein [Kitasatospora sp. NPDC015120]|uniref:hypothetical protein n=1 Tax=Kitasatospora sp. NPDC015120 TaxID=3364023 RepID=UPI0036F45911